MTRNYWQIAAGGNGRDYTAQFLKYGIAFVGGTSQEQTMRTQVECGDIMLLKRGLSEITAVGEVVDRNGQYKGEADKSWLSDFDGWNVPAYCYVDWHQPELAVQTQGLTRATIQRVHNLEHQQLAEQVLAECPRFIAIQEPRSVQGIDYESIVDFLITEGLRTSDAEVLAATLRRIRRLGKYYYQELDDRLSEVREHETRAYMVIPLLLALGWSEQQMKVEHSVPGGQIDIVCFSKPYHRATSDDCVLIIETKGLSSGLDYAHDQAHRYAVNFPACEVLVVSNGTCYKTYRRNEEQGLTLTAYLNLQTPTDRYHLDPDNVDGAFGVLRYLLPRKF